MNGLIKKLIDTSLNGLTGTVSNWRSEKGLLALVYIQTALQNICLDFHKSFNVTVLSIGIPVKHNERHL